MKIQRQTVSEILWQSLSKLMKLDAFANFRLVGGTSLSLMLGHRKSVDIDLFTDVEYGGIDFDEILEVLKVEFEYVDFLNWNNTTIGNSCFIGNSPDASIKLDLYYTDPFVYPIINYQDIRLSRLEEVAAMKLDVIGRGGRKKDFWDIHALFDHYDLSQMLDFYSLRYPYNHSKDELILGLINFESADTDPDPICLEGKYWELIKLDFEDKILNYRSQF